ARHAVLYRQNVSEPIPKYDLCRAPRLLEPDEEDRRRRYPSEAQQGWHREVAGAISHRLSPEQRIQRPAGGRAGHEGRLAAGLGRSRRGDLPRDLWQRHTRHTLNSRRDAENLTAKSVERHPKLTKAGFTAETPNSQ